MDTDDLSDESYSGIILEAEKYHHDLTLHFGILSSRCKTEIEYLELALDLIRDLKSAKQRDYLDLFFDINPTKKSVNSILERIENNIREIKRIPITERKFSRWGMPHYLKEQKRKEKNQMHRS